MGATHDQTLYWGWIPHLDPGFEFQYLVLKDRHPEGIEQISENVFIAFNDVKGWDENGKRKMIRHSTTFRAHIEDNFIVLEVISADGDWGYENIHADRVYNALKGYHHPDCGHVYGKGLSASIQPDLPSAIKNTYRELSMDDYLDEDNEDRSLVMDAESHIRYVSYLEYSLAFLERYRRFFQQSNWTTYHDKVKTRLDQAERLMPIYTSIRSLETGNSSMMTSIVAIAFSIVSLAVALSTIITHQYYIMAIVPIVSGAVLGVSLSELHKLWKQRPRKAFG